MEIDELGITKEPLAEKNVNVASCGLPVSKIPAFGGPASGLRPPSSIPSMMKRLPTKSDKEEMTSKRQRLEPSPDLTLQSSSDVLDFPLGKLSAATMPVKRSKAIVPKGLITARKPTTTTIKPTSAMTAKAPVKSVSKPTAATATNGLKASNSSSSVFVFKGSAASQNTATTRSAAAAVATAPTGGGGKKRPAWDTKGRLEDMEVAMSRHLEQNAGLQTMMLQSNERIALLESINSELKGNVKHSEQVTSQAKNEIETLQRKLREKNEELESSIARFTRQLSDAEFTRSSLERQKSTLEAELSASQQEILGLKNTVAQLSSAQAGIEAELSATKLMLDASRRDCVERESRITACEATIASQLATINDANDKLRNDEMVRRRLHNTILELKGNIRVFSRVRPLIGDESLGSGSGTDLPHIHFPEDKCTLELERLADANPNESVASFRKGTSNKYEFKFDRVFGPTASQAEVFEEICQLVQSALDGYNVCIFAYGQTGSGKTFTMEGPNVPTEQDRGMIPRAVTQIFESSGSLKNKGWTYQFEVTFVEIYNETIRDLLGNGKDDVKHEIKLVAAGSSEVYVTDLTTVKVNTEDQVNSLLLKASHNRSVAETRCNEHSSRSHSVFRMSIKGHNEVTDETCNGLLNLIDLAGSERLKESGSQGQRLKETQSINKSLANLGNVIMALANKEKHVPYRDSKLTHLLQNCLGGSSKTLMFVNVSPKEECFQETLNSLRFATKVNDCNIGTAQKKSAAK